MHKFQKKNSDMRGRGELRAELHRWCVAARGLWSPLRAGHYMLICTTSGSRTCLRTSFFFTRSLRRSSSCSCIRERVVPSSHSHPRASVPTLEEEQGAQCQTASYLVVRTWLCRGRVPSTAGRARVRACCQSAERRTVSKSDSRQSAQRPIKPKIERPKNRLTQTMEITGRWRTEK